MDIQQNVSLKDKNWFETGGSAKFYVEVQTTQEFSEALKFAREKDLNTFVLGCGANILISDDGYDGLVIKPNINSIEIVEKNRVKAGSGVTIENLIKHCFENGYVGLHEFSGIPGTVGGSVYINLHYFNFLLSNFVVNATVIEKFTGNVMEVENDWFGFGYEKSKLIEGEYYLIDATFKVESATLEEIAYQRGRSDEIIRHRKSKYPYKGTCGSFFRNFYENEVNLEQDGRKVIWAAYYLDKIGVKGALQIGGARVSYQHANMIVNTGNATSNDIVNLAREMQKLVKDNYGVVLNPECQLIGFKEYPLLME